jgi:Zn finger protein HypA/HybF involved in hydrogenase expression
MKIAFGDQYKHPLWQKRRLEIMESNGFECEKCNSADKTLNVHHKQYFKGRMLWEYSDDELSCLCEDCHKSEHDVLNGIKELLTHVSADQAYGLLAGFFGRYTSLPAKKIEEVMSIAPFAFASGFAISLSQCDMDEFYKIGEFSTRNNQMTRDILENNVRLFGRCE